MSNQNNIQDELRNFGSSLPARDGQPFSVPEGYFDSLPAAILAKVKAAENSVQTELQELSPLLAGIPKTMPYSVPSFYFQENTEALSAFGGDVESPVLAAVGKKSSYQVPVGYFDGLPEQILAKLAQPKAKVVPLFARTWMRVAAAAVVAGALVFGGVQVFSDKQDAGTLAGQQPKTETSVAQNKPAIEQEIKKVSTTELEQFIESVPVAAAQAPKQESASAEKEAKALLQDVSVNEMERFLSSLPATDDELTVTD